MKYSTIFLIFLTSIFVMGCDNKEKDKAAEERQQKETAKEIRKGEFEKSSGKKW